MPFKGKPFRDRFMEPHEFRAILVAAKGDEEALRAFVLMGFGGLRTIEVTRLKVGDLDHQKRGVWTRTAKRGDDHVRFVPLRRHYGLVAAAAGGRRADAPLVTRGGRGITRRQVRYLFHRYKRKARVRDVLGPHSMRHLAAMARSEAGARPQELAAFLGHKSLDMVLVYSNLRDRRNEEMADGADEVLFRGRNQPK